MLEVCKGENGVALKKFGFIVTGFNPPQRIEMQSGNLVTIISGVKDVSEAPATAAQLCGEGVELIELCGAFGALGAAPVIEAVQGKIPIGFVGYGPEAIEPMHKLFG